MIPKPQGLNNIAQGTIIPLRQTKETEPSVVQFKISHRPKPEESTTAADPLEIMTLKQ